MNKLNYQFIKTSQFISSDRSLSSYYLMYFSNVLIVWAEEQFFLLPSFDASIGYDMDNRNHHKKGLELYDKPHVSLPVKRTNYKLSWAPNLWNGEF